MADLELRENGVIAYDGLVIGKWDAVNRSIMLDAGWMDMAEIGFVVRGNPEVDSRKILARREWET